MQKIARGGHRKASGTGGTPRITGLSQIRPNSTAPVPHRPAFLPDHPQEQGQDSKSSRISEPGETRQGYTGGNIGA